MTSAAESQVFSPRRFARLARLQWQEQRRAWAMFALVLAVLLALMAGLALAGSQGHGMMTGNQVAMYFTGLLLSGYLFAHQVLGAWRSREASLMVLMRPASAFEKWLLCALTLLVLYPLLYTAVFVPINAVFGELGHRIAVAAAEEARLASPGGRWRSPVEAKDFVTFLPLRPHPSVLSVISVAQQAAWGIVYAGLMAYAALGLVYFRRHAALRTLVVVIGLCILTFLLMAGLSSAVNFHVLGGWLQPAGQREGLPLAALVYGAAFWTSIPLLLWAASYRALRERDLS